ncbi:MAG: YiiD C-terminal domain-containing protein [Weeksellaceae bacterium]|jgi:hypothetical protein|nr:YiiD C-terminal domain-containing protein [Weeksellaceae bacterium]
MNKSFFHKILFFKLPIAKIAGLKLYSYNESQAQISVKLSWLNQNPFKSMFWAVQGMAAELSTGVLCMMKIKNSNQKISMLVVAMQANFTKKAVGKIIFKCEQGKELDEILEKVITTKESQTLTMKSIGTDEKGDCVSEFFFTWSFKVKS